MHWIQELLPKIEHLGLWGYWLVLLAAVLESLAFVGLFVPGTVILIFVGFLASQKIFDLFDLMWFAAAGSILGDTISYYLGKKGMHFFRFNEKIINSEYFVAGEEFLKKHGGKGVFFGRFIGPIRPIVPFAAGFFKMNFAKFQLWNVLSAVLWAAFYITLGYFSGHALTKVLFISERISLALGAIVLAIFLIRRLKKAIFKG